MPRCAILRAVLLAAAVSAVATAARAQTAEPLRRLDARTLGLAAPQDGQAPQGRGAGQGAPLAGGDYGAAPATSAPLAGGVDGSQPATDPSQLAGGGYGEPDAAARQEAPPAPIAPSVLADPLSSGPGGFRRPGPRPIGTPVDDAYAPAGVKAGAFTLRPSIETAAGYDDNPNRIDGGEKGAGFLRLRGELNGQSDWSRHAVDFQSSAQIRKYESQREGYEPEVNATLNGRLDVTERTQINTQLRGSIIASQPGDPETPTSVKGDEISRSIGATLGIAQRFNRLSLRLDGLVDRYTVDDSKLENGGALDNSDRAYNAYQARLRASYEISPKLQPFVEGAVDTRDYDQTFDNAGQRRLGSDGFALRGGAQFELGRLVAGELGLGYGRQTPKQNGLEPVEGLLIDGALAWTPTALTTVRATARTGLQETSLVNASGILDRSFELSIEHFFRRNFSTTGRLAFERADYKGVTLTQDTITAGLDAEYRLNRTVALTGSLERNWVSSTGFGQDYVDTIIEFGLRFRR